MQRRMSSRVILLSLCAAVGGALVAASPGATASAHKQHWSLANVGAFGGEPSIAVDPHGHLYVDTPSGGMISYRSANHGRSWAPTAVADKNSGDDCLATDQSGAIYQCNLAGSNENAPLQADVWKSVNGGKSWKRGDTGGLGADNCGTSCSAFGVDRDWLAAQILAPHKSTKKAEVVLMYHDFYGPSSIWVNISHDGGRTFGSPVNTLAPPATTPGAVAGSSLAEGYTFCSTVPAGVGIVPSGHPHAGRIIVGWIASDPAEDAAGCNVSQYETFHTLWVSYSDDGGKSWTPQLAYDTGVHVGPVRQPVLRVRHEPRLNCARMRQRVKRRCAADRQVVWLQHVRRLVQGHGRYMGRRRRRDPR
jgi:hypothetical protein